MLNKITAVLSKKFSSKIWSHGLHYAYLWRPNIIFTMCFVSNLHNRPSAQEPIRTKHMLSQTKPFLIPISKIISQQVQRAQHSTVAWAIFGGHWPHKEMGFWDMGERAFTAMSSDSPGSTPSPSSPASLLCLPPHLWKATLIMHHVIVWRLLY